MPAYICRIVLMRYLLVILLMGAFALQNFQRLAIVLDYYSNQRAYAVLCENRNKPQLHCNGKCQMMKKLKAEEKNDANSRDSKLMGFDDVVSSRSFFAELPDKRFQLLSRRYPEFSSPLSAGQMLRIFRPPAMI
jgi:hypothetical protein